MQDVAGRQVAVEDSPRGVAGGGVPSEYLAAAGKSTHSDELAEFEAAVRALHREMARITISPSWARFYDFGAGRLPKFLRRLVEPGSD